MIELDKKIFVALNTDGGAFWDSFFHFMSSNFSFAALGIIALAVIARKYGLRNMLIAIAALGVTILFADQVANLFKNHIDKLRPIYTADIQLNIHFLKNAVPSSLYGTVSGHAANSIGIALLTSLIIRKKNYTFFAFLVALTICYSRIYLAAHFPLDLLFGSIVGLAAGSLGYFVYFLLERIRGRHSSGRYVSR